MSFFHISGSFLICRPIGGVWLFRPFAGVVENSSHRKIIPTRSTTGGVKIEDRVKFRVMVTVRYRVKIRVRMRARIEVRIRVRVRISVSVSYIMTIWRWEEFSRCDKFPTTPVRPWLFRPLALLPPGSFAAWFVRSLVLSPPTLDVSPLLNTANSTLRFRKFVHDDENKRLCKCLMLCLILK